MTEPKITFKCDRAEYVRLMLATVKYALDEEAETSGRKKWMSIYDKMREHLDDFDTAQKRRRDYVSAYKIRRAAKKEEESV